MPEKPLTKGEAAKLIDHAIWEIIKRVKPRPGPNEWEWSVCYSDEKEQSHSIDKYDMPKVR